VILAWKVIGETNPSELFSPIGDRNRLHITHTFTALRHISY